MKELRKDSVVRGHHVYKSVWTHVIDEELYLESEESNEHNEYAVAIRKDGKTVGHVPHSFSHISWYPAFISYIYALPPPAFICDQAFA